MSEETSSDRLVNRRALTIVFRLVVDARGKVMHGELLDVDGVRVSHFLGWRGLTRTLHQWIDQDLRARVAAGTQKGPPTQSSNS